jgi:hypothetical protein
LANADNVNAAISGRFWEQRAKLQQRLERKRDEVK